MKRIETTRFKLKLNVKTPPFFWQSIVALGKMVKISYKGLDEETSNTPSVKSFRSNRLKGNVIGVQRNNLFFFKAYAQSNLTFSPRTLMWRVLWSLPVSLMETREHVMIPQHVYTLYYNCFYPKHLLTVTYLGGAHNVNKVVRWNVSAFLDQRRLGL